MRKQYGGTQVTVVSTTPEISKSLECGGRLLVGMVSCRMRPYDEKMRFFRCLAFGHVAKTCSGPNRSDFCRRCGANDHKALNCVSDAKAVKAFMTLTESGHRKEFSNTLPSGGANNTVLPPGKGVQEQAAPEFPTASQ